MGKPTFFTRRGEKTVPIQLLGWNEPVDVTICIPTNREHDEMMEAHTEYGMDGSVATHSADLIEDRLIKFIIDLEFEIPINLEMSEYKKWKDATDVEKRLAINLIDPKIRDEINNLIAGKEELSEEEEGN